MTMKNILLGVFTLTFFVMPLTLLTIFEKKPSKRRKS